MTTTSKPRPARRRKPKPKPVVKQRRNIKDLTFFELGLIPFLYLEGLAKLILNRFSPKAS